MTYSIIFNGETIGAYNSIKKELQQEHQSLRYYDSLDDCLEAIYAYQQFGLTLTYDEFLSKLTIKVESY